MRIGRYTVGDGHPVYVIGEIGLNHNGDVEIAKKLIDVAVARGRAGGEVPEAHAGDLDAGAHEEVPRETPWGTMTYLEYRYRVEFEQEQYAEIGAYADSKGPRLVRVARGTSRRSTSSRRWTSSRTRSRPRR